MGFKEDADFARFVSMGAVGVAAVAFDLSEAHGHRMVELERYAMANKVWQTKVKRLRLPDLLIRLGLDSDETVALHAIAAIKELPPWNRCDMDRTPGFGPPARKVLTHSMSRKCDSIRLHHGGLG